MSKDEYINDKQNSLIKSEYFIPPIIREEGKDHPQIYSNVNREEKPALIDISKNPEY